MWAVICNAKLLSNTDSRRYIIRNINKQTDVSVVVRHLHAFLLAMFILSFTFIYCTCRWCIIISRNICKYFTLITE